MTGRTLISLFSRAIMAAFAGAVLYVIWIPGNSMIYDLEPTGQDQPITTAVHVQTKGHFGYFRNATTYHEVSSATPAKVTSGFSTIEVLKSIAATLLTLIVLFAAIEPGLAKNSLRHLTMRWSGS